MSVNAHEAATSLSQLRRCTERSSNLDRNEGHRTQTELSIMDICGDLSGCSALAIELHDVKKGFTTDSFPTTPRSIAILLNFSHYYTLLPSLTSWKARVCPRRTSSVLEVAVGGGKEKARQPPLFFPQCTCSPSPSPLFLAADRWQLRLTWGLGWADRGTQEYGASPQGIRPPRTARPQGCWTPPESWAGMSLPPHPSPLTPSARTRGMGYMRLVLDS